jgi:hypothetical protein
MWQLQVRFHWHEKADALCVVSRKSAPEITMLQNPSYRQTIRACDNLMKNPKLTLYEEVEGLKRDAQKARNNVGLLNKLTSDLSFLIERLSSAEKVIYLRCCENDKETRIWDSTEP